MPITSMQTVVRTTAGPSASGDTARVLVRPAQTTTMGVVVVAVDFSPASVRAARAVLPMLAPGGRLVLVHVRAAVGLMDDTADWSELYERRCRHLLDEVRRHLQTPPGVTVETRFLRGEVAQSVTAFAAACGAVLIACGRKRHAEPTRAIGGDISSRLLRAAACPVLVVSDTPGDAVAS
ncbi:MAG: universal stress protein [bacterium]